MSTPSRCPRCGLELKGLDLDGLCPRCLGADLAGAPAGVSLEPGARFHGVEVGPLLGRGGMGVVYRARQLSLDRDVALKVLKPDLPGSTGSSARFEREAKALAALNHPNVVQVYDFGREGDVRYLVLEHVAGGTLQDRLDAGPIAPAELVRILQGVCAGLQAVHGAGIVHRDLKPSNILMAGATPKISDFGLATDGGGVSPLTETGAVMGSVHYLSPEQARGGAVDARSDLYALGVILYQGLAGKRPFDALTVSALVAKHLEEPPDLDGPAFAAQPALREAARKLLTKDPRSRPRSASEAARALKLSSPPSVSRRALLAAAGVAALAVVLALSLRSRVGPAAAPSPRDPFAGGRWESLGSLDAGPLPSLGQSAAFDPQGNPVLAWSRHRGNTSDVFVRSWRDGAWRELGAGDGISANPGASRYPQVAVDAQGRVVVAWDDDSSGNADILVKRWDGVRWEEIGAGSGSGGGISANPGRSVRPSLALDVAGNPVVAWQDASGGGDYDIYVKRWDGRAWVEPGGASARGGGISRSPAGSYYPSVAVDAAGLPWVAWEEDPNRGEIHVRRWDGKAWAEAGEGSASGGGISRTPGSSSAPCLALDRTGRPLVAWYDTSGNSREVYLRRWDGSGWAELGKGSASGEGLSDHAGHAGSPRMALDDDGNPLVVWDAWHEGEAVGSRVYLKRWTSEAWSPLGRDPFLGQGGHPVLALGRGGALLAAFDFRGELSVMRWTPAGPSAGAR